MDKLTRLIIKLRIPVIIGILLIAAVCFFAMNKVVINYDNASYLDETTTTYKALELMDEEFEKTGNILMMIPDISEDEAEDIQDEISDMDNVLNVSFDGDDESSYIDGDALFAILTAGDDYSDELAGVYEKLQEKYDKYDAVFGGSGIDNMNLQSELTTQIVYILGISLVIVLIILMLTATSWIEPILFLIVAGIGILINRGTNVFLGDISYITNAVSAILQLALSMDYSIMLLHRYHNEKSLEEDKKTAMAVALKKVMSPVSCSALTTIAGLMALVFMNFKIGFDIGTVLMKGIVISALLVFTMLPGVLLIFDNLLEKTKKKPIKLSSKGLSNLAVKHSIPVFLVSVILIGTAGYFSFDNDYFFSVKDTAPGTDIIKEEFGETNTLAIIYRDSGDEEKEIKKQEKLKESIDGYDIKDFISYENTALEELSIKDVEDRFDLSHDDAVNLFTMYQLYTGKIKPVMTCSECVDFVLDNLRGDADADTIADLEKLVRAEETLTGSYTASGLSSRFNSLDADADKDDLKNLYALYEFENDNSYKVEKVSFMTMVSYMRANGYGDKETLDKLVNGLDEIDETLSAEYSSEEFAGILVNEYGISSFEAAYISGKICPEGKMSFRDYLAALDSLGYLPEEKKAMVEKYESALALSKSECTYRTFAKTASQMSELLTGEGMDVESEDVRNLYIAYFMDKEGLGSGKHKGLDMVEYMLESDEVSDSIKEDLNELLKIHRFFNDTSAYTYREMAEKFRSLSGSDISEVSMSGVYIRYAAVNKLYSSEKIAAADLCSFISDNMYTNDLLDSRMSKSKKQDVRESMKDIEDAESLFKGDEYSRLLIRTGLPAEGEESYALIEELKDSIEKYYDNDAQIAGTLMVTYDLESVFDHDLKLISIVTVASIFAIIMLTFLSASIPVILVLIIQGAIWMSMCTSVITGNSIFFMAYVVALCVLMGATIDYAILLTNHYLSERKLHDKADAIRNAIKTALPTVFTSGLILITAGLTVYFVATETAISTVGLLIGKGAIFSVISVLFILPSFLVLLDKVISKTTFNRS